MIGYRDLQLLRRDGSTRERGPSVGDEQRAHSSARIIVESRGIMVHVSNPGHEKNRNYIQGSTAWMIREVQ